MDKLVHPDAARRFAHDLNRVWPEGAGAAGCTLGLAISGGPDSVAMLLLAQAAIPGQIEAATVDHGLRPEAAEEAQGVAELCAELAVPHQTLDVTVANGNLQDAARRARYGALGAWAAERGLTAIATAHHADDQAETLLMRLNRGSGVGGLAGVRERGLVPTSKTAVLRPLLGWRRSELAQIVEHAGVNAAQDPSNGDDRFDRIKIRRALAAADWLDPTALAASGNHLADADAALEWMGEREWQDCVSKESQCFRYVPRAPRAVRLRVVARIIAELGSGGRGGSIARLVALLAVGQRGTLGGVVASAKGDVWIFEAEAPRKS